MDNLVHVSGALNVAAASLSRTANAVRWMACGPRAGIMEITLPTVQPGSSIMPGKVNPVLAESLLQVCAHVAGSHAAVTMSSVSGAAFELHTSWPLAGYTLVTSAEWLAAATAAFARRCVDGIAPTAHGPVAAARSLMCVTGLLPVVGYDRAAAVAKLAAAQDRDLAAVALEELRDVDAETIEQALAPSALLGPHDSPAPPPSE
jgi:fumarate hydratase class II